MGKIFFTTGEGLIGMRGGLGVVRVRPSLDRKLRNTRAGRDSGSSAAASVTGCCGSESSSALSVGALEVLSAREEAENTRLVAAEAPRAAGSPQIEPEASTALPLAPPSGAAAAAAEASSRPPATRAKRRIARARRR